MDAIVAIPVKIVEWLQKQEDMKDITFFVEYPPVRKAVPLKKCIVAVGIESIKLEDKFVENDTGVLEKQEYCRLAKIRINVSICVPFSRGGHTCHDIFTRIANALTFRTNLNIEESGCSEIVSDRDTDALVMNGRFLLNADFCPAKSTDENFESFLNKELICGSHVRNTDIHTSTEEKEKWNNPYEAGIYVGTGTGTKTVNFTFKPKFICVFAAAVPLVKVNFTEKKPEIFFALASDRYSSPGISLTANGFKTVAYQNNGGADMNAAGTIYYYVALK